MIREHRRWRQTVLPEKASDPVSASLHGPAASKIMYFTPNAEKAI